MTFKNLGLLNEILRSVSEEGYTEPTPIQAQAIPLILEGSDVMAGAQTGTGKTAGFTLPLLHRLASSPKQGKRVPRALILTPTRELAAQIGDNVRTYGKYLPLRSSIIYGGASMNVQTDHLRKGVDILIATPGRLLDHANQRTVDLSCIEVLVLDEADRMLDMGFIHDIRKLLSLLPEKRQNLLFSATFSPEIKRLASGFLKSPKTIEVAPHNTPAELVAHRVYPVDNARKRELLFHLISSENWQQVLVFTRTKHGANRLADYLADSGVSCSTIHGNKSQAQRMKALDEFHRGAVRVLVATDIAARGIDIEDLPHVVNYELPNVPEDYIHRIGRTGRAGKEGAAISLVCVDERQFLRDIEKLLNRSIEKVILPGFEPDPRIAPQPIFRKRHHQPKQRSSNNRPQSPRNSKHYRSRS